MLYASNQCMKLKQHSHLYHNKTKNIFKRAKESILGDVQKHNFSVHLASVLIGSSLQAKSQLDEL